MIGIAEMFAEFDGYERYEARIEQWAAYRQSGESEYRLEYRVRPGQRRKAVDRMRQWRKANPDRAREQNRRQHQLWKERNYEAYKAKDRRSKALYRQRHPEKVREWNRRNQAARRARLKAQEQARLA